MSQVNEKPSLGTPPSGSIRFNTDSSKMEKYNGEAWWNIDSTSPAEQTGGTRGLWGGGGPSPTTRIDFVNVDSTGDAIDFGDMLGNRHYMRGYGNRTRGLWGHNVESSSEISFVTISSTGNAQDFGDMLQAVRHTCGVQSPTRGILPGGWSNQPSQGNTSIIQYLTTSTTGNSVDFGDVSISESLRGHAAGSNGVRGVYGGGIRYPSGVQTGLEFITMATLGNGATFGDLTYSGRQEGGGCASRTRAVFGGAYSPSALNTINYVNIMTTGDAIDYGDLTIARGTGALSNGHGALG